EFFLRKGYPTYVVDQASRGRSAADPTTTVGARQGKLPPGQLPAVFSAGREGAWKIFRFGPEYPKIYAGLQYPLQAQDQLWKQMVPDWSAAQAVPNPTVPDLSLLVKRLGGAILVSHSQSGIYPFQVASIDPSGIAAIVALEPGSCPKPDEDVRPYTHIPTLLVYGDFIAQSTDWWVPRLKACEAFVEAINAAGGKARIVHLPDVGFHGNTHMMMQDLNSLDVAEWLSRWLDGHGGQQRG
ncbi:MAG TPA: esterase, partial [Bordetella sp.]